MRLVRPPLKLLPEVGYALCKLGDQKYCAVEVYDGNLYYIRVDVMSLACIALCELYILMQSQIPDRFHTGNTPLLLLALSELPPGPQELQVGLGGKTPYTMAHPILSKEELEGVEITYAAKNLGG